VGCGGGGIINGRAPRFPAKEVFGFGKYSGVRGVFFILISWNIGFGSAFPLPGTSEALVFYAFIFLPSRHTANALLCCCCCLFVMAAIGVFIAPSSIWYYCFYFSFLYLYLHLDIYIYISLYFKIKRIKKSTLEVFKKE